MKRIAIVGCSKTYTEFEETDIRKLCVTIIESEKCLDDVTIISGGASGVDSIAVEVAKGLGVKTNDKDYLPESYDEEGYLARNVKIAESCDMLYCISTSVHRRKCYHHGDVLQDHEKTAGCWTLNKAKELNKKTAFFKV